MKRSMLPTAYKQDILRISRNNLLVVAKCSSATRNVLPQKIKTSCFFKDLYMVDVLLCMKAMT